MNGLFSTGSRGYIGSHLLATIKDTDYDSVYRLVRDRGAIQRVRTKEPNGEGESCVVSFLIIGVCSLSIFAVSGLGGGLVAEADRPAGLAFSTFVGGSKADGIRDVVTDREGNIYITGGTESPDFPVSKGAYQTTHNPSDSLLGGVIRKLTSRISPSDVFVAKLDGDGKVIWSTFIGGPHHDRAYAIEVDGQGYVYVAGRAGEGFPVTPGAFQTIFMGGEEAPFYGPQDGFVCKLKPDGSSLVFCSYFGASDENIVRDLALGENGDIYIGSSSSTGSYPQNILAAFKNKFQPRHAGKRDSVVARIKSDGSQVVWATYLGGSGEEWGAESIRTDDSGNVYFVTVTESADMPTTPQAYDRTYNGKGDFYLAKLRPDGSLVYGTYVGGSQLEHVETHQLVVDKQGNAIIVAGTTSTDFPTTSGGFQTTYGGSGGRGTGQRTNYPGDAVVAKISSDGTRLLASTFVGGRYGESAEGAGLDRQGNVYFTGTTFSNNFPVTPDAFQPSNNGKANIFVVKLSADFSRLVYSTYLGGSKGDAGRAATVDTHGNFYVGGGVRSKDFPTRNALQPKYGGNTDGALAKFTLDAKTHEK